MSDGKASDGKDSGGGGGGGGAGGAAGATAGESDVPTITVTEIEAEPNMCPVQDALRLNIKFTSDQRIVDASWTVQYTVDSTRKRYIIQLGESKTTDYDEGANEFEFEVDKIDVSGIKPSKLTNVGLLAATLNGTPDGATKPRHIIDVNLVVQVSEEGGEFKRCIFNPLE